MKTPLLGLLPILALSAAAFAAEPKVPVDLLIAGGTVVTMDPAYRVVEAGAVAVEADRIVAVDTAAALRARYAPKKTIDATGRIVMPGLVNAHTHVPMTLLRGMADDVELMVWLTKYIWPAENANVTPEFVTWGAPARRVANEAPSKPCSPMRRVYARSAPARGPSAVSIGPS